MAPRNHTQEFGLYAADGARKYLNEPERRRVLAAMQALPTRRALFALCLAWTGARVSEVLGLCPSSFQIERSVVAIRTLKRRRHVVREVPIPPKLMAALDRHFALGEAQRDPVRAHLRLWPWCRETAWRFIRKVITASGVTGSPACPRGLRHGFAVNALLAGVPIHLVQRWLGHSRIDTTAIYTRVCGVEEVRFAERFWHVNDNHGPLHGTARDHDAASRR
jgi:integrase